MGRKDRKGKPFSIPYAALSVGDRDVSGAASSDSSVAIFNSLYDQKRSPSDGLEAPAFAGKDMKTVQMEQEQYQDEVLMDMSIALQRLNVMGGQIGLELEQQHEMLDELEGDMDVTESRLEELDKKMQKMMKGSCKFFCSILI